MFTCLFYEIIDFMGSNKDLILWIRNLDGFADRKAFLVKSKSNIFQEISLRVMFFPSQIYYFISFLRETQRQRQTATLPPWCLDTTIHSSSASPRSWVHTCLAFPGCKAIALCSGQLVEPLGLLLPQCLGPSNLMSEK